MSFVNGMRNLGNTCYLNVALQCLLSLDSFPLILHSIGERNNPAFLFLSDTKHSGTVRSPDTVYDLYLGLNRDRRNMPEDAMECLLRLLDYFETRSQNTRGHEHSNGCLCNRFWYTLQPRSIVQSVFDGIVFIKTTCKGCKTNSHRFEIFRVLPIYDVSMRTVTETIDRLVTTIDEIEHVHCEHCHDTDASYSVVRSLHRLPLVILFECMDTTSSFKIEESFTITHLHGNEHRLLTYRLKTIGLYSGNHYNCICYDRKSSSFVLIDDEKISSIDIQPSLHVRFLAYERIGA